MNCRSCNGEKLELILDLGNQPWCNDFLSEERIGKEEKYPLRLNYCHDCELLQLDHTVPKENNVFRSLLFIWYDKNSNKSFL